MSANENNLIWIDLEMTGLDPERDRIIEIATLVTDANLNILAEGPTIAVHQSDAQLALMDEWNVRTHTGSGLVDRVKASTVSEHDAELATIEFLKQWVPAGKSPICGNSIGQDRRFLFKYMPQLEAYFHYRYLDVSTLKELARRWKPEILDGFKKQGTHQAMDDIRESVAELKGESEGKLRLGVIPTIAPYLLHKCIPAFVRDYPKVELEISEMVTSDIVEALKRDRIDAALVASGTCGDGILEQELFNDRFFAYVSPENPLYERQNIRIEDIDLRDLVILSAGNCMRDQIIELCQAKRDMPSHYSFESGSLDTLMRIVDCTSCLTIIPEMAVEYIPADHRDRLKMLAKGATSRKIAVAVRRTYVKSSIIKALTDTIMANAPEVGN